MEENKTKEFEFYGGSLNGFLMCFIAIILWGCAIFSLISGIIAADAGFHCTMDFVAFAILVVVAVLCSCGFTMLEPNEAKVMTFFGKYVGTFRKNGFYWLNPLMSSKKVSLRARNLNADPIKVNDKAGNPVLIGLVLVWRLKDTYKAIFDIDTDVSANAQSKLLKSPNEEELKNVFDTLKKECDLNNDNRACAIYGDMLVSGIGCDRNLELGLSVLNQSAAKADLYALSSLGYRYYNGIDVEPNEFKAFRLLNVSCDNDDFGACRMVSSIYRKGLGVGVKKDDLIKIYQQKCDEQIAVSCHKLANIKNASEDEHETKQALELLKMGCDLGGVRSCVELGDMYSNGTINQRDDEYAFSCYKTACDKNDPIGCLNLGYAYRMGSGIEQDIKLAYKLFHKSCKRGSSQACAVLAQMPRVEDD